MIEKELEKKTVKSKKNVGGRPTVMTESVVNKLVEGFSMGFTDSEACLYADISKQTLYDYCKKNPSFVDRKEHLKDQPKMIAKANIVRSIKNGDITDSKWYAERKGKDEFSLKHEVEQSGDLNLHVDFSKMTAKELDDYIEANK